MKSCAGVQAYFLERERIKGCEKRKARARGA